MNWKSETWGEYKSRLSQYREWFAWYPVWTEGRFYWLEKVLRRYQFSYSSYDGHEKEAVYKPLWWDKLGQLALEDKGDNLQV